MVVADAESGNVTPCVSPLPVLPGVSPWKRGAQGKGVSPPCFQHRLARGGLGLRPTDRARRPRQEGVVAASSCSSAWWWSACWCSACAFPLWPERRRLPRSCPRPHRLPRVPCGLRPSPHGLRRTIHCRMFTLVRAHSDEEEEQVVRTPPTDHRYGPDDPLCESACADRLRPGLVSADTRAGRRAANLAGSVAGGLAARAL